MTAAIKLPLIAQRGAVATARRRARTRLMSFVRLDVDRRNRTRRVGRAVRQTQQATPRGQVVTPLQVIHGAASMRRRGPMSRRGVGEDGVPEKRRGRTIRRM